MTLEVSIIVEETNDGFYAHCPELPGCQSEGTTTEDASANLREAILLYLSTMEEQELTQLLSKHTDGNCAGDINAYRRCIKLTVDPLTYQQNIRAEWD